MIYVDHLVKSCEGDPEKISGLMVLLAMACYAMGAREATGRPFADLDATNQQLEIWHRATEELEKQLRRCIP